MLSLLKKKSNADAAPAVPSWHPNFRNFEKLPDTKVVRTAFFVNLAAITIAAAAAIYFGLEEWRLRGINNQIAQVQAQIDRDKKVSDQAVALYKKFQAEEAKIVEVDTFIKSKPSVSAIIMRLAETLPPNIAVDNLDFRESGVTMRLSVKGAPDVASGHATSYLEQLRADKQLGIFDTFDFTSTPTLNPTTGRMAVEFFLHLKGTPPGRR
jgi:hypothetical protein